MLWLTMEELAEALSEAYENEMQVQSRYTVKEECPNEWSLQLIKEKNMEAFSWNGYWGTGEERMHFLKKKHNFFPVGGGYIEQLVM